MSFLAPLFLLGALAIVGPVLLHLARRTTRQRTAFSSLMFLRPTPPRLTHRNRLEHLLLLALRCLVIGVLAAGFARPFFKRSVPEPLGDGAGARTLVLVDTSASMRRGDLWRQARERAEAIVRRSRPADQLAMYRFDRTLQPVLSFADWQAAPPGERLATARARLGAVAPSWSATYLDNALMQAAELLAEDNASDAGSTASGGQIIVISDLQEGSRVNALAAHEWPKNVRVLFDPVVIRTSHNASVQWVHDSAGRGGPEAEAVRLRVHNTAQSEREQFSVGWVTPA